jgi:hypothetical protein
MSNDILELGKTLFSSLNCRKDSVIKRSLLFDGFSTFEDKPVDINLAHQWQNRVVHIKVRQLATGQEILKLL